MDTSEHSPRGYNSDEEEIIIPLVKIVDSPFCYDATLSYGLIFYSRSTDSWLMVQRKHTIGLISILKNLYTPVAIPTYVSEMSSEECERILKILSLNYSDSYSLFVSYVQEVFGRDYGRYTAESWKRLNRHKSLFLRSCELRNRQTYPDWGWPRGHPNKGEDPKDAAFRELFEECNVGVIVSKYQILETPIEIECISDSRYRYKYVYWVCIAEEEFSVTKGDEKEVKNCKWVKTENVSNMIYQDISRSFTIAKMMVSKTNEVVN